MPDSAAGVLYDMDSLLLWRGSRLTGTTNQHHDRLPGR